MDLHKISKIAAAIIGVLSIVLTVLCISAEKTEAGGTIEMFILLSYVALFLTIGAVLYFVVLNFIADKDKKTTLISLGLFVGVILVAFVLADSTEYPLKDGKVISSGESKFISTSLNTFYIMALLAVGSLVYSSVGKFKK